MPVFSHVLLLKSGGVLAAGAVCVLLIRSAHQAPAPVPGFMAAPDPRLDRWALLLDLMATYRQPRMLARLARRPGLVSDHRLRHHLAPFAMPDEALAALRHLRRFATDPAALDPLIGLLQGISP